MTSQLEIRKLYVAMGASAGGVIELHWAVNYPDMAERMIGTLKGHLAGGLDEYLFSSKTAEFLKE